jgi:glucosamine--fructose-6-phosphate aminotransferase (isomerizing)
MLATPSVLTLYKAAPSMAGALVIGISQSGQSPDVVAVLEEGRRQGRPTLAITNDPASPLAGAAEHIIQLHAGPERAVAATKTYTASLAAVALLSTHLENDDNHRSELVGLPAFMQHTLNSSAALLPRFERYRYMQHCAVIGRGYNYATAFEIALKVKELASVIAEPYSSADFLHGPIAVIAKGFPALVVAPSGAVLGDLQHLVKRLIRQQAELILISDTAGLLENAHVPIQLPPGCPEWLTPMVAVLPGQLFGLSLARMRAMDPDHPGGLSKVTETW